MKKVAIISIIGILILVAFVLLVGGNDVPAILPTPSATPEPLALSGTGDSVVELHDLGQYSKAHIVCTAAKSHFAVIPYDSGNNRLVSLVNEITPYDGVVKWDARAASLEIKADGKWTITLH